MTEYDVTAFGESMLRLSVPAGRAIEHASSLDLHTAGAESNVLSTLAQLGIRCGWNSALPQNALGRLVSNQLRMRGIDLSGVIWKKSGRIGIYFIEIGSSPRPTEVIYDRHGSCHSQLKPEEVNWESLLDTRLLHLTGITPALSSNCREICREAIQRARQKGIPVSFDVNYRAKLWPDTKEAVRVFSELAGQVELLFCPLEDAERVFGFSGGPQQIAEQLGRQTHAANIILSMGDQGVFGWNGRSFFHQPALPTSVLDPIGAGDALAAGVIHGWLAGSLRSGLKRGAALAALALSQYGDMPVVSPEVLAYLTDKPGGKVLR